MVVDRPRILKQAESQAHHALPLEHGGSKSHTVAWPDEGVPEERFDFSDWPQQDWSETEGIASQYREHVTVTISPEQSDQQETLDVVLDIFR